MMNSIIEEKRKASRSSVTLFFHGEMDARPGQFIMVWAPEVGEIPVSFSHVGERKGITIKPFGATSTKICSLQPGERIFYRGPYGRPFREDKGKRIIIGGGTGLAGLLPLIDRTSTVISAARTAEDLLFHGDFQCESTIEITDDGTSGMKGFPVDALKTIDVDSHSVAYICGPEMMMYSVYSYLRDYRIDMQLSMERIMKCGVGICDSCSMGGFQTCRDGPTFFRDEIPALVEFGTSRTSESGRRYSLKQEIS